MPSEPAAERIGTGCGENQPRNPGKGEPGHAQSQGQENTAILGGSAGIGLATAALLPERGAEVTGWWDALPEADRRAAFTQFAGQTPVGRNGTAEDVAQAIAALIENDYITGVVLRRRAPAHLNPAGRQSGGGRRCRLNPKPEEALMRPLTEQAILITGATDGHGLALATELAARGATVLLHGRDDARGRQAIADIGARTGNDRLHWLRADLASLDQVRDLADRVLAGHPRLDAMINNAGIGTTTGGSRQRLESRDGYELRFGVNYLAGYLLTRLLLPRMQDCAPARIVNVASAGQAPIDFDDVMLERHYDGTHAYGQSKLAQVMFTLDLAGELDRQRVTANCLHPATYMPTKIVRDDGITPASSLHEGTRATLRLIAAPELDGVTGRYYSGEQKAAPHAQAHDEHARRRLRELSDRLCGLLPADGRPSQN